MKGTRQFSLYMYKGNCLLFFLLFTGTCLFAQKTGLDSIPLNTPKVLTDSTSEVIEPDSLPKKALKPHSPKKAAIFSAVVPGAGQVYNRKYWKVPVIYAGFGGLGYLFMKNNDQFRFYRDILVDRADSSAFYVDPLPQVSNEQIYSYREDFRRYRDLTFIGIFAIYIFNIIDASVDAHMFTFDVSEDLSMHVQPYMLPSTAYYSPPQMGVGITLKW